MATLKLKIIPKNLQTVSKKEVVAKNATTASKRKKPKRHYKKEDFNWMFETYPHLFKKDNPLPLKASIFKDFMENKPPHLPIKYFREFFRYYTIRNEYLKNILKGGNRYDINGHPFSKITDSEIAYTKYVLKLKHQKKN